MRSEGGNDVEREEKDELHLDEGLQKNEERLFRVSFREATFHDSGHLISCKYIYKKQQAAAAMDRWSPEDNWTLTH